MSRKYTKLKRRNLHNLQEKYEETKNAKYKKQMYQLLLSQLDDLSQMYIRKLDTIIDRISFDFMGYGGWSVSRKAISSVSSVIITPEYSTETVVRDINGYHMQQIPEEYKGTSITLVEEKFLAERKIELEILHRAFLMKDDILYNRHYTLKDPSKEALVEELREFFGYNHPEDTILPPKTETVEDTVGSFTV